MATALTAVAPAQLAHLELFVGLGPEALADVAARGRVQSVAKGTILFTQGAAAAHCHALIAGRVRISQSGEEGGQLIVRFVGPGEMFGTVALFTDRRYPATAAAVLDSLEISWTEAALLELIHRYPQIALNALGIVGARLREVQERLRELATQRVDQRMARVLLRLARRRAAAKAEKATIDFPVTRQDLAEMCGTTLYSASRILTAWERAGILTTRRRQVTLQDLSELERIAGETPQYQPAERSSRA